MMNILKKTRFILFPLSIVLHIVLRIRHFLYDWNVKKSTWFTEPIICVGNLNLGGSGKTPMIEFLIRMLQDSYSLAVISRGYKRKGSELVFAQKTTSVSQIGDEPFQIYNKFPNTTVAVHSNRVFAFKTMQKLYPSEVTLLDDAFQHRKIKAGLNILLTPFYRPFPEDFLFPTGNLRDLASRAKHAQIIVVTKCPENLTEKKRKEIIRKINPKQNQHIFFSYISYGSQVKSEKQNIALEKYLEQSFTLVTGIANASPFVNYLKNLNANFTHINFSDHHHFSEKEIEKLRKIPRILTTEKDFVRLSNHLKNIYYLPIEMKFFPQDEKIFKHCVLKYIDHKF